MATQGIATSRTVQNLTTALSLRQGVAYLLQNNGTGQIFLHEGSAQPAATTQDFVTLAPEQRLSKNVTGEALWIWSNGASHLAVMPLTLAPGPLRDKVTIDISSADYANADGFVLQNNHNTAQSVTYTTLHGASALTESLEAGAFVAVAGTPVLLRQVAQSGTVVNLVIGRL